MTHNLVICQFLEQSYIILNLCTFFGISGIGIIMVSNKLKAIFKGNLLSKFVTAI